MKYLLSMLSIIAILLYCAPTVPVSQMRQPFVVNKSFDKTFKKIIMVVQNKGYVIAIANKESGFIATDWKVQDKIIAITRTKLEFTLEKIDDNHTKIYLNPVAEIKQDNVWHRLKKVGEVNLKIINEIKREIHE